MVGGFAGSLAYTHPYRSNLACSIALDAVSTVVFEENGHKEIDIKQYAKVRRLPQRCARLPLPPRFLSIARARALRACPLTARRALAPPQFVVALGDKVSPTDIDEGMRSLRRLAGLEFETALFSHGRSLTPGAAASFRERFAAV